MAGKPIDIQVVSDLVCPWCYVGKRRLEQALELRPDIEFAVTWQPFQLNPDMPREGRNRQEYYREKFGSEKAQSLLDGLRETGAEVGIEFGKESNADAMAPNTLSAHVLMHWASQDDAIDADALGEKLFHAHHVSCEDIGDHAVLARIAGEVGMDSADVRQRLAAGEDEDVVTERTHYFTARGVTGVPFFVINDEYGISGAQPAEVLVSAFEKISGD